MKLKTGAFVKVSYRPSNTMPGDNGFYTTAYGVHVGIYVGETAKGFQLVYFRGRIEKQWIIASEII